MDKKDILKAAGVDYDGALSRFMGNEALLMRFLNKFLDDPNFLNLATALAQGDAEKAFQAAHTLKGVAGNLSLSGLYEQAAKISEALRSGDLESAKTIMPDVKAAYKKITEALAQD